jgi:mannose-6-phosphate isomerase-like protein (cupin superfamily)
VTRITSPALDCGFRTGDGRDHGCGRATIEPAREYFTRERCHILELANIAEDPAVSIARARVGAAVTTAWHRLHGIVERYVILEGCGWVEVGDRVGERVAGGDVVHIPPGVRQRIRNVGATDLVFLAICTPRYFETAYEALEP